MGTPVVDDISASLRSRMPVSLEGLVVQDPEYVNHGGNFYRWRIEDANGILVGQVRVYNGRGDETGRKEEVYIPTRRETSEEQFLLPHAEQFSAYLRENLGKYLAKKEDQTPIDVALRKGPEIIGVRGNRYFLRWNIYFKDEKIGEYTIHDDAQREQPDGQQSKDGERSYRGIIPGYTNICVVQWNEVVADVTQYRGGKQPMPIESVTVRWIRTVAPETPDNKFFLVWKRGDNLTDIAFP